MYYWTDYFYSDGNRQILIARIFFNGSRISYHLYPDSSGCELPQLANENLDDHINRIVNLPLALSELRSKSMPECFSSLKPHTLEHFRAIPRNTTFFKFSKIAVHENEIANA